MNIQNVLQTGVLVTVYVSMTMIIPRVRYIINVKGPVKVLDSPQLMDVRANVIIV